MQRDSAQLPRTGIKHRPFQVLTLRLARFHNPPSSEPSLQGKHGTKHSGVEKSKTSRIFQWEKQTPVRVAQTQQGPGILQEGAVGPALLRPRGQAQRDLGWRVPERQI